MKMLTILPRGVTSKKVLTGARSTLFSVILCTSLPIERLTLVKINSRILFRTKLRIPTNAILDMYDPYSLDCYSGEALDHS
jgi:hypothetical protein